MTSPGATYEAANTAASASSPEVQDVVRRLLDFEPGAGKRGAASASSYVWSNSEFLQELMLVYHYIMVL